MPINKYPEFSENYPAIDGIKKERLIGVPPENPIRSDVEEILKMNDRDFYSWYKSRKSSVLGLLNQFEILVTIPDLRYGSEDAKHGLDANASIKDLYETLKRGLEYVEVIEKVKYDQKNP